MSFKPITAETLNSIISAALPADSILIDVRTPMECSRGMIRGAVNIPADQITTKKEDLLKFNKIYLYCLSGARSDFAADALSGAGFPGELYSLVSGLLAWRKNGFQLS